MWTSKTKEGGGRWTLQKSASTPLKFLLTLETSDSRCAAVESHPKIVVQTSQMPTACPPHIAMPTCITYEGVTDYEVEVAVYAPAGDRECVANTTAVSGFPETEGM